MLKAHLLRKQLGDNVVLADVNMNIADGSIFGLIGPNGAGKSTLLRLIAGVYTPDLGCITMDDQKIQDVPELKKDILLISDDPFYFYNATLHDMKQFYKVSYPDFDEFLYQSLLRDFEINETISLSTFSKGMKRQAFIILGLAIAPRYLLLDEAFDGLDPLMRLRFKRAIMERIDEKKMSVVISSHNLREMEDICDSFAILQEGRLTTAGDMVEVLGQVHKFQMAFAKDVKEDAFAPLHVLSFQKESRVINLVAKGDAKEIEAYIQAMNPLMLEIINVSLEELFVYEMRRKVETL